MSVKVVENNLSCVDIPEVKPEDEGYAELKSALETINPDLVPKEIEKDSGPEEVVKAEESLPEDEEVPPSVETQNKVNLDSGITFNEVVILLDQDGDGRLNESDKEALLNQITKNESDQTALLNQAARMGEDASKYTQAIEKLAPYFEDQRCQPVATDEDIEDF